MGITKCIALYMECIKGVMRRLYASFMGNVVVSEQRCSDAAAALNELYEMVGRYIADGVLRRYAPYMLADFIIVVTKESRKIADRAPSTTVASQSKFRLALKNGLHVLVGACATHEMQQLHTVLSAPGRVAMGSIVTEFRQKSYKGN